MRICKKAANEKGARVCDRQGRPVRAGLLSELLGLLAATEGLVATVELGS